MEPILPVSTLFLANAAFANRTVLRDAIRDGNIGDVHSQIALEVDISSLYEGEKTSPLIDAIENGYEDIARLLVDSGADLSVVDAQDEYTPLEHAVYEEQFDLARHIIATGRDPEKVRHAVVLTLVDYDQEFAVELMRQGYGYHEGYTPLHIAIEEKLLEFAKELIEQGTYIENRFKETNETALHLSIKDGHKELVACLIAKGANVNVCDFGNYNPLHHAIFYDHPEIVCQLLKAGANIFEYTNNESETPFSRAIMKGQTDCFLHFIPYLPASFPEPIRALLQKHEGKLDPTFLEEMCQELALHEEIVQNACSDTTTPLEVALAASSKPLAKMILQQMTEEQRILGLQILCNKAPSSISAIVELFFQIDMRHIGTSKSLLLDDRPLDVGAQDLRMLSRAYRLQFPDDTEVAEGTDRFLDKVEKEEAFLGTPKAGSNALKDFYKGIRDALSNVVAKLTENDGSGTNESRIKDICTKLAASSGYCGIEFHHIALELYGVYCLGVKPSIQKSLLHQLQILRGVLVESMVVEPYVKRAQSVHAVYHMKHVLRETLHLADRATYDNVDVLARQGFANFTFPDESVLLHSFLARYTPYAVYNWIKEVLTDERERNLYLDWAQVQLKHYVPDRAVYKDMKRKLQAKQEEIFKSKVPLSVQQIEQHQAELLALSTQLGIDPIPGYSPLFLLKDERRGHTNSWLLGPSANSPSPFSILMLLKNHSVLNF